MKYSFAQLREKSGLSCQEVAEKTGCTLRTVYKWENNEAEPGKSVINQLSRLAKTANRYGGIADGELRIAEWKNSEFLIPKSEAALPLEIRNSFSPSDPTFTFIDLFAGIGGMRLGFEAVGGQCVFTCEWDKFSRQTYQANYLCDHAIAGDIRTVTADQIPSYDVLLAGFPCQPFSIAGVSKKNALGKPHGFLDETQGTLFFDIARILKHHQPKAFLLENVKNLKSHDKGRTFRLISKTLRELGYHIDYRVINAKGYVPQNRERIFIAGFRDDTTFTFDYLNVPSPNNGPKLRSILHPENGSEMAEPHYTIGEKAIVSDKYTLSPRLWVYLQGYAAKHKAKGNGFGYGLVGPDDTARTLSARYYKDGSEILIKQLGRESLSCPRRLTPRECARLMGFDRPGKPNFEIPVSDTQAYKQFGNAVVVPVIEAIAEYMLPHILNEKGAITYKNEKQEGRYRQLSLF